jgi:DNA-binding NarL/FixJ family response regulator
MASLVAGCDDALAAEAATPDAARGGPAAAGAGGALATAGDTAPAAAPMASAPMASSVDGLSGREIEVLRLVAAGLSNRAIGERLHISPNTAANHVRSILQKTASANRAEATAYGARHALLD